MKGIHRVYYRAVERPAKQQLEDALSMLVKDACHQDRHQLERTTFIVP